MDIIFLGTSAAWPIPRPWCHCPQCASKDPKDNRTRSSLLINQSLLIDAPPDIYQQLKKQGFPPIKAILLTHGHHDHILGLRELVAEYLPPPQGKIALYGLEKTLKKVEKVHDDLPYDFHEVTWGKTFTFHSLPITFFPVEHSQKLPTSGIQIGKLFYAPDVYTFPEEVEKVLRECDMVIWDGTYLTEPEEPYGHQSIDLGEKRAKALGLKTVYYTHIGHHGVPFSKVQAYLRPNHHIAWDGLVVSVGK